MSDLKTFEDLPYVEFNDETVWLEIYPSVAQNALGAGVTTIAWWTDLFDRIYSTGLVTGISVRISEIDRYGDQSSNDYPTEGSFVDNDGETARNARCLIALSSFPFKKMWTRKMWFFHGVSAVSTSITDQFGNLPLTNYFYNENWWYYIRNIARDEAANFGFDTYNIDTEPYATFKDEMEFGPSNQYNYGLTNWSTQDGGLFVFDLYPITEVSTTYDRDEHITGITNVISGLRTLAGTDTPFPRSWSTSTDPSSTNLPKFWSQLDEIKVNQKTFYYPLNPATWFGMTRITNDDADVHSVLVRANPVSINSSEIDRPHTIYEPFEHTYLQRQVPSESHLDALGLNGASLRNLRNLTNPTIGWTGDGEIFEDFKNNVIHLPDGSGGTWNVDDADQLATMDRQFWHRFWGSDKLGDGQGHRGELMLYVDGTTASQGELSDIADDLVSYSDDLVALHPVTGTYLFRRDNLIRIRINTGKFMCIGPCIGTQWQVGLFDSDTDTLIDTMSLTSESTNDTSDLSGVSNAHSDITVYEASRREVVVEFNRKDFAIKVRTRNISEFGATVISPWSDWSEVSIDTPPITCTIGDPIDMALSWMWTEIDSPGNPSSLSFRDFMARWSAYHNFPLGLQKKWWSDTDGVIYYPLEKPDPDDYFL